jgi:hypothetical protein
MWVIRERKTQMAHEEKAHDETGIDGPHEQKAHHRTGIRGPLIRKKGAGGPELRS